MEKGVWIDNGIIMVLLSEKAWHIAILIIGYVLLTAVFQNKIDVRRLSRL
jgi:hypothetical protein